MTRLDEPAFGGQVPETGKTVVGDLLANYWPIVCQKARHVVRGRRSTDHMEFCLRSGRLTRSFRTFSRVSGLKGSLLRRSRPRYAERWVACLNPRIARTLAPRRQAKAWTRRTWSLVCPGASSDEPAGLAAVVGVKRSGRQKGAPPKRGGAVYSSQSASKNAIGPPWRR